jgi:N-ethylmaleimide reductase
MDHSELFKPLQLGALKLAHRIVMAPLTRNRAAQPGNVPWDLNVAYYAQRATPGGLLISEASQIMPEGQGYPATPGIYSDAQIEGWRRITDAVHARGGLMLLQLWHVGRISHSSLQPGGALPVAPSALAPSGVAINAAWQQVPFETPRALRDDELPSIVDAYRQGARNALLAGFDGVEIHSANGYLLDQFLQDRTNRRDGAYGGTIEHRARLLLDVVRAVIDVVGADRVGVRLSPYGTFNDMGDSDPLRLFAYVIGELSKHRIAYLHLIEPRASDASTTGILNEAAPAAVSLFRTAFAGPLVSAGGYDPASAARAVTERTSDAVAFGRAFIANPDLVERIRSGAPLNPYDRSTFYGGDARGYLDYPTLTRQDAAA